MNKTILVVYLHGGEFDERYENALVATNDRETAERYIKRCKVRDRLFDRRVDLIAKFSAEYVSKHPRPVFDESQRRERVKWSHGMRQQDITEEMRRDRKEVDEHNSKLMEAYGSELKKWRGLFELAQREYLTSIRVPKRKHDNFIYGMHYEDRTNRSYSIDSLRVI